MPISSGYSTLIEALRRGLEPDPILTVSEWADTHRMLSGKASAEKGPWRTSRTPYLREIMDCLSITSPIQEVVFMKGAQIGATECGNNWIGYVIDYAPGPMMAVQPTLDMQKRNVKTRIDPMVDETPRLRDKVAEKRAKDGGNAMFSKEFNGGVLILTGANSATGLRSMPVRWLFLDEIDAYPGDLDEEGDPIELARARTRTFPRRKIFTVSTPTISGRSKVATAFEETDQRYYFVPCPHCGTLQKLVWSNVVYDRDDLNKPAIYACEEGCEIEEHHKTFMLENGEWRATAESANPLVRGYHLSALYSPLGWYSWSDAARDFVKAENNPTKLRAFTNTVLGEPYADKGDTPNFRRLYERRDNYDPGTVPKGGVVLFCGADVQRDRIEAEVVAFGRNMESWSVDYKVFPGDTADLDSPDGPWAQLDNLLNWSFQHENGEYMQIMTMAVDANYRTQTVYNWVRRYQPNRVIAVQGREEAASLVSQPITRDVQVSGKKVRRGVRAWMVGTNIAKTELYGWLRQEKPLEKDAHLPYGFCHFPEYEIEYFKQLCAEQLTLKRDSKTHRAKYVWEKIHERNEPLDCRVYARAASAVAGIDRWQEARWATLEEALGLASPEPEPAAPAPAAQSARPAARPAAKPAGGGLSLSRLVNQQAKSIGSSRRMTPDDPYLGD